MPKALTYIGLISYSLYLLYQFIGYALIRNMAPLPIELRLAVTFIVILAVSAASYHLIERGFEKWALRYAEPLLGKCREALLIPYRNIHARPWRSKCALGSRRVGLTIGLSFTARLMLGTAMIIVCACSSDSP